MFISEHLPVHQPCHRLAQFRPEPPGAIGAADGHLCDNNADFVPYSGTLPCRCCCLIPACTPVADPDNLLIRLAMAFADRARGRPCADPRRSAERRHRLATGCRRRQRAERRAAPCAVARSVKAVWQAALDVVGQVGNERHAVIFALPVVLVAGCKGRAELPSG